MWALNVGIWNKLIKMDATCIYHNSVTTHYFSTQDKQQYN